MRTITPDEIDQLVGNGYCYVHVHPKAPLDFSDRLQLMSVEPTERVTSDHTLGRAGELVLVDTSLQNVTITLPLAARGREFCVVKMSAANEVRIVPTPPERILGITTATVLTSRYSKIRLKAVVGDPDTEWIAV